MRFLLPQTLQWNGPFLRVNSASIHKSNLKLSTQCYRNSGVSSFPLRLLRFRDHWWYLQVSRGHSVTKPVEMNSYKLWGVEKVLRVSLEVNLKGDLSFHSKPLHNLNVASLSHQLTLKHKCTTKTIKMWYHVMVKPKISKDCILLYFSPFLLCSYLFVLSSSKSNSGKLKILCLHVNHITFYLTVTRRIAKLWDWHFI